MKYLAVARVYNEGDDSTPSSQVWCKVMDCEKDDVGRAESIIANDFIADCEDCDVKLIPLEENEWILADEEGE